MDSVDSAPKSPIAGKRVAFVGKLGGLTRREAAQLVRDQGGIPVERSSAHVDCVVVGAEQLPLDAQELARQESMRDMAADGVLEIIAESEFWRRLGLLDTQHQIKQLYTPAMLADLLKISIATVRRWHRMGLIEPKHIVHRLPYFDFQEVQSARQVANWVDQGAKPGDIQRQLHLFAALVPNGQRSLMQLDIIVEGRQLLLRRGEGLIEAGGQRRIDFDSLEVEEISTDYESPRPILRLSEHQDTESTFGSGGELTQQQMLDRALELETDGRLREAIEWYRVALARFEPTAELHFQLAELLYREGEVEAARERYYAAIELDDDFVEARANLGCVLHETGRTDLAIAAFRGALAQYEDYADVHYHLARVLDESEHRSEATFHWRRFAELAPQSPWIFEAQERLGEDVFAFSRQE
jgi:tetratricopeptide (TPR) repeat protein